MNNFSKSGSIIFYLSIIALFVHIYPKYLQYLLMNEQQEIKSPFQTYSELTLDQIEKLDPDQLIKKNFLSTLLTPQEAFQCMWQISMVKMRQKIIVQEQALKLATQEVDKRRELNEKQTLDLAVLQARAQDRQKTIQERNVTIQDLRLTISAQELTINTLNRQIADTENQGKCWTCFLLKKERFCQLVLTLVFSIVINIIFNIFSVAQTEAQKAGKANITNSLIGFSVLDGILMFICGLGRCFYLEHQKHCW